MVASFSLHTIAWQYYTSASADAEPAEPACTKPNVLLVIRIALTLVSYKNSSFALAKIKQHIEYF